MSAIAYPLAVLVAVLALLGFVEAGNQVVEIHANSGAGAQSLTPEAQAQMASVFGLYQTVTWSVILGYGAVVIAVLLARAMRLHSSGAGILTLSYLTGDKIRADGGVSLLEAAQMHDVPHANLCQGRGRCGTCRVRIISSSEELPQISELERKTLDKFASPDNVRLACQLVPKSGEIELERLLSPDVGPEAVNPPVTSGTISPATQSEATS